jgi:hypothetical protein
MHAALKLSASLRKGSRFSVFWAICLAAVLSSCGASAPPLARCEAGAWTAPATFMGERGTLRYGSLATSAGGTFAVGIDIPAFDAGTMRRGALLAVDTRTGRSIGRPPGRWWFLFPQAAPDSDGRLHVLWGEPKALGKTIPRRRFPATRTRTLWHAVYDRAEGWSRPQAIHRVRGNLLWNRDGAELRADPAGGLHAIVAQTTDARGRGLVYLRLDRGRWSAHELAVQQAAYASVSADAAGRVTVAAIAHHQGEPNRALVVQSGDGGTSWTAPRAMPAGGQAHGITVREGPRGALHVQWRQNVSGGFLPEVIRHVASSDGGASWSKPSDLNPRERFQEVRSAVDRCGAVHVLYRTARGTRSELRHTRWQGGWSRPRTLLAGVDPVTADLGTTRDGELVLFASARPATSLVSRLEPGGQAGGS